MSLRPARDQLLEEEDMTGTVREYLYAGGEAPTAMRARQSDGSYANYFFVTNTHGDVVAVTDKDGEIVNRYAYGPWGEATRVSEQVHQPFRYAGYRYEDGFDLYYLRARWMDPNTGQFMSRDEYRGDNFLPPSLNRHVYALSSPPTMKDPTGRSAAQPRRPFSWRNLGSCPGSSLPLRGHNNWLRRWMQVHYYNVDMINLRIEFVEPRSGNLQGGGWYDYYFGSADNAGLAKGPPNPVVYLADYVDLCDSVVGHFDSIFVLFHEVAHIEDFSAGRHGACPSEIPTGASESDPYRSRPSEIYANCRGAEVLNQYNSELDLADRLAGYG